MNEHSSSPAGLLLLSMVVSIDTRLPSILRYFGDRLNGCCEMYLGFVVDLYLSNCAVTMVSISQVTLSSRYKNNTTRHSCNSCLIIITFINQPISRRWAMFSVHVLEKNCINNCILFPAQTFVIIV